MRRVIGGFIDKDGDNCVVLDDGSIWYYGAAKWRVLAPPLPPEALGVVGKDGDEHE